MADAHVVVGTDSGLSIVDGQDPTQPVVVGRFDLPEAALGLALVDQTLFVADGEAGLAILDLTDPTVPTAVATLAFPARQIEDVEVGDGLAIVVDRWGEVFVVDVMDPTAPTVLGSLRVPGYPRRVALRGHVAAISGWYTTLVDFQNPGEPVVIGGFSDVDVATVAPGCLVGLKNLAGREGICALPRQCGDDPIAAQVWGFAGGVRDGRSSLEWSHLLGGAAEFQVCGRHNEGGADWTIPAIHLASDRGAADDASPAARRPGTILYRLEWREGDQSWQTLAETAVVVPTRSGLPFLAPARPNPFNPRTTVAFTLAAADHVDLAVYDAQGRRIATLVEGALARGEHAISWDGRDATGRALPSGTYFARLATAAGTRTTTMMLVR